MNSPPLQRIRLHRNLAEIYRALVADQDRLEQIVTDVLTAHRQGAWRRAAHRRLMR